MARRPPTHAATKLYNPEELGSRKCSELSLIQIVNEPRRLIMSLTAEQREQVATELKRFAGDLNLTDDQKEKLQAALAEAREKVGEHLKNNPNATKADIIAKVKAHRDEIRQRVVNFLSPEQLSKWDSEVAKAKEFLGQKVDA
jgi:periplasmic protein CpxP/Spy